MHIIEVRFILGAVKHRSRDPLRHRRKILILIKNISEYICSFGTLEGQMSQLWTVASHSKDLGLCFGHWTTLSCAMIGL